MCNQCSQRYKSYLPCKGVYHSTGRGRNNGSFLNLDLQENGTVTVDIHSSVTTFSLYVSGINSIEFLNTYIQVNTLYLHGIHGSVHLPYNFIQHFPSVRSLRMSLARFERFPFLNSISLTKFFFNSFLLPNNIATIQPSNLNSSKLILLRICSI